MKLNQIPVGEGRTITVGDEQVAVFRLRSGAVRALAAVCPHGGGPLADGMLDERVVVCPLHGFTYDLEAGTETSNGGPAVCAYKVSVDAQQEITVERC